MTWLSEAILDRLVAETLEGTEDSKRKSNLEAAFKSVPADVGLFSETRGGYFDENDVLLNARIEGHQKEYKCTYDEALSEVVGCTPMKQLAMG